MKRLELNKDYIEFGSEFKDILPRMVDVANEQPLKKIAKQKAIFVYIDNEGKELKPTGKGIIKEGKVIPLNKVEGLKATGITKTDKSVMDRYAVIGEFEVSKTSLELKENEAVSFFFALMKGYANMHRSFIYKDAQGFYTLRTTTFKTKEQMRKGEVVSEKDATETLSNATEQIKMFGIEI